MPILGVGGDTIHRNELPGVYRKTKKKRSRKRTGSTTPANTNLYQPSRKIGVWKLYVLKLKDGCYYVGITRRSEVHWRYRQHNSHIGAKWTILHPPVSVYETYWLGRMTEEDAVKHENRKTLELIASFGVTKVRGGQLVRCNESVHIAQYKVLKESMQTPRPSP